MQSTGQPAELVLTELGLIAEAELIVALADFSGLRLAAAEDFPTEPVSEDALSAEFLRGADLLPLFLDDDRIVLATPRLFIGDTAQAVAYFLDRSVELRLACRSDFEHAFRRLYASDRSTNDRSSVAGEAGDAALDEDIERLKDVAREAPIVRLVSRLVATGVERRASDVHIEPLEGELRVRYRIDGALVTAERLSKSLEAGVVSRAKILARMNIAERRLPQDGRIKMPVRGRDIDLRVSTAPTLHGESVVLRILDRQDVELAFAALGFSRDDAQALDHLIAHPNGVVLVTGPTGSGKTTTLYSALKRLNREDRKIFTVEDPVEYQLPGVSQVQVRPQIGLDFAAALRSILRQDPDIVMIGEMRDSETARIAIQAALTGHLVLSTLHTNSAIASITRLIDMGVEDFLLASTLRGIVAQRLVRRLCEECAAPSEPSTGFLSRFGGEKNLPGHRFRRPVGCDRCGGTGYRGRTTIYEIAPVTDELRQLIVDKRPEAEIETIARQRGMRSLFESGLAKAAVGETSLDEVLHATLVSAR
jgi:general secretion pathway protein E